MPTRLSGWQDWPENADGLWLIRSTGQFLSSLCPSWEWFSEVPASASQIWDRTGSRSPEAEIPDGWGASHIIG